MGRDSSGHRRRRQLCLVAGPGRRVLQGRRPQRQVVPGLMHVQLGDYHVRDVTFVAAFDVDAKKVGQDLSDAIDASENNTIKIADVPPTGDHRAARPHPRRTRQVLPRDDHRVRRRRRSTSSPCCARPGPTSSSATCPSAPSRPRSSTRSAPSTPASASSTRSRCSSPAPRSGPTSSPRPACRSSVTTSRARSARPSRTACSPSCSRTAASSSTGPTSSTSAATWTS